MRKATIAAIALLWVVTVNAAEAGNSKEPQKSGKKTTAPAKKAETKAKEKSPSSKLKEADLDRLLLKSPWPEELHSAVKRVAFCESSWNPKAKGPTDDHGLLQIRFKDHAKKVEHVQSRLYDPSVNLAIGFSVYREASRGKFKDGFAPWYMSQKCHGQLSANAFDAISLFRIEKAARRQQHSS
jgi:hypothetical protein